jgi:hypothetical protein
MAFLGQSFNSNELPQAQSFEPLPAGWYSAAITEAELKTTKSGTGHYIKLKYQITGPTHEGRVVFGNVNIRNQNDKAEEIGLQQLNSIMSAIGLASVEDSDQLIGGVLQIKLTVKRDEQYGDGNEVKGFKSLEGSAPPAMTSQPKQEAQPQQQAAQSKPPWAR